MVDGRVLQMTEKTWPERVAIHIRWGPVMINPFRLL